MPSSIDGQYALFMLAIFRAAQNRTVEGDIAKGKGGKVTFLCSTLFSNYQHKEMNEKYS